MKKDQAIELLGGTIPSAASALGVSYQAVNQWPDDLPPRIEDRVLAAVARARPKDWPRIWRGLAQSGSPTQEVA